MVLSTTVAPQSQSIPFAEWEPEPGAVFLVDTKDALGYLINEDGTTTTVPVLLGQNRVIRYINTYKATTPEANWVVKSVHTQGDRVMFGREGTFLRLYKNGDQYTHYGIHSHAYFEDMLEEGNPFRSYGCILVAKDALDKIQEAYELNGDELKVVTVYGLDQALLVQTAAVQDKS